MKKIYVNQVISCLLVLMYLKKNYVKNLDLCQREIVYV